MRPIDADELLLHKRKMSGADFGGEFWDEAVLASDIENAPAIDAVKVIRCKDCKHYDGKWFCKISGVPSKKPCDFCSYGERKDGVD